MSIATAQENTTNITTTTLPQVPICPSEPCMTVWGSVINLVLLPQYTRNFGQVNCSFVPINAPTIAESKYSMVCDISYNLTQKLLTGDYSGEVTVVPSFLLEQLDIENVTKDKQTIVNVTFENTIYKIIVVILAIVAGIFIFYYWYAEHGQFE